MPALPRLLTAAPRDGGDDRHLVPLSKLRMDPLGEADDLIVQVHVHASAPCPGLLDAALADPGVVPFEVLDPCPRCRSRCFHPARPARQGPELGGDLHRDAQAIPPTILSTSSTDAGIRAVVGMSP